MQRIITKLINPDQTGFIPGRQGAINIRRTLNIISCAKRNTQKSMLISFDAQKAFNQVNWCFLYENLAAMGFHSRFIDWIKVLYIEPKSRLESMGVAQNFRP